MPLTYFTAATALMLSLTGLVLHRKHLISALLCIEGLMLALFLSLTLSAETMNTTNTLTHPIILLALSACEASTGLALLVASSRSHASDHMNTLNLLKC